MIRKCKILNSIFIIIVFTTLSITSIASTIELKNSEKPGPKILTADIIIPDDFSAIQKGIDNANPGDTVFVRSGIYEEDDILIDKKIFLIGENVISTIIEGDGTHTILVVYANEVSVSNFTISDGGNMMDANIVLMADNCLISNNFIDSSNDMGIALHNSSENIIEKNIISNCSSTAIRLNENNFENTVKNNIIKDNGVAVLCENSDNNYILDNTFTSNVCGITFSESDNNTVENNMVSNSEKMGFWLYEHNYNNTISNNLIKTNTNGILIEYSHNNHIFENTFTQNQNGIKCKTSTDTAFSANNISGSIVGIYLYNSYDIHIQENKVRDCSKGIYLEESDRNTVEHNRITSNEIGIFLSYSVKNMITENNLISNIKHCKFSLYLSQIELEFSKWDSNYYDTSFGLFPKLIPGVMHIGTEGISGIFIPWISIDWHPAKQPH